MHRPLSVAEAEAAELLQLVGGPVAEVQGTAAAGLKKIPALCDVAGVLQRRLIGPIWKKGTLVTEVWLGDPRDPEAGSEQDVTRALQVTVVVSCIAVVLGILLSGN